MLNLAASNLSSFGLPVTSCTVPTAQLGDKEPTLQLWCLAITCLQLFVPFQGSCTRHRAGSSHL